MSKILVEGTFFLNKDEPAFLLREEIQIAPDFHSYHRYQFITVIRDDKPVVCKIDLGLAEKFKADTFNIIGGGQYPSGKYWAEETVGRLQDMADYMRNKPQTPVRVPRRNMMERYADLCEQNRNRRKNAN